MRRGDAEAGMGVPPMFFSEEMHGRDAHATLR